MCANGFQFPDQYCSDGLMFNGEVCDWPENVECGNSENDQVLIKIIKNHIQLQFRYTGTVLKDVRKIHQPGFFGHAMQNVVKLFQ